MFCIFKMRFVNESFGMRVKKKSAQEKERAQDENTHMDSNDKTHFDGTISFFTTLIVMDNYYGPTEQSIVNQQSGPTIEQLNRPRLYKLFVEN